MKKKTFLLLFVFTLIGGTMCINTGFNIVESKKSPLVCSFYDFMPPIKIKVESLDIPIDNGLKPYSQFIISFPNGTAIRNITLEGNNKNGYFYFNNGFLIYAWSGELNMEFYDYNLVKKWQIWRTTNFNSEYSLLSIFKDELHVFLLSAYRNPITNELSNYCLEWGNVEKGDIVRRFCSDKEFSGVELFGGKVVNGSVYILSSKGIYLFTYHGELIKKKEMELSKIESFDVNEKYLAFAYPISDNVSKLCVLTSNLKSQRCIEIKGKVRRLKICGNYLHLEMQEDEDRMFEIKQST